MERSFCLIVIARRLCKCAKNKTKNKTKYIPFTRRKRKAGEGEPYHLDRRRDAENRYMRFMRVSFSLFIFYHLSSRHILKQNRFSFSLSFSPLSSLSVRSTTCKINASATLGSACQLANGGLSLTPWMLKRVIIIWPSVHPSRYTEMHFTDVMIIPGQKCNSIMKRLIPARSKCASTSCNYVSWR